MKKVKIKFNPYLIKTQIEVDGKVPKVDSALNVSNFRLQEWIEKLPQTLIEEYRDRNFEIEFVGTSADYSDVLAAIKSCGAEINAKCTHYPTPSIDEVEATIDEIFKDIKENKLVPELRSPQIIEAFEKAKDSSFEVNVVATMSSGKSTLINALLGQHLMPAANEATTATIVKIVDTDQEYFTAKAYDKSGNIVVELDNVTLEAMKELNSDERVSTVELRGKIPFVESTGMKLVLVDTPGPNNSRDKRHEEMTYSMIANSDKSLVLYVMNGTQLGINDEKNFLDYICNQMKKGGKQSRERFIFAVNKMDDYRPTAKHDGEGCINRALHEAKKGLETRGIKSPNLFPVGSLPALQLREMEAEEDFDEDDIPELEAFTKRSRKYKEMQFEKYYDYSNLPYCARNNIERWLTEAQAKTANIGMEYSDAGRTITEIFSGIVSIEQAICLYVNKYARTQKVVDLVNSFNIKLEEMSTIAKVEDEIAKDKNKAAELERQIDQIKKNIAAARQAKSLSQEIDKIDLITETTIELTSYLNNVKNQINKMMSGESTVEKSEALDMCRSLENQCKAINAQINVELRQILDKAYSTTLTKIVNEYKQHIATLNLGLDASALSFSPLSLVSASLASLNSIIEDNTESVDEGGYETFSRRKEGGFLRKTASFLSFGIIDDYVTESYREWVPDYVDYVDMREVTHRYLEPFQRSLKETQKKALEHIDSETKRLKNHLKKELVKIDEALDVKLEALTMTENNSKLTVSAIKRNEERLRWLKSITQRVKNIIEF